MVNIENVLLKRLMSAPFLVCALVTAISALISFAFFIVSVRESSDPTRTVALYTLAQSTASAAVSFIPLVTGSLEWLKAIATGMILLRACDAAIGISIEDRMKILGPAGMALTNLAALIWLMLR